MTWAPDYATVAELAEFMRITDELDNAQLSRAVAAASRAVDSATGRQFGQVAAPEQRLYRSSWDGPAARWLVDIDDTQDEPTAVAVDTDGTDSYGGDLGTSWTLLPYNAASKGAPWTSLRIAAGAAYAPYAPDRLVAVTALWGWSAVPATVVEATLIQGSRYASRRDSPYGVTGTGDGAPALRLQAKADPDVEAMLRPYRRSWWVAS